MERIDEINDNVLLQKKIWLNVYMQDQEKFSGHIEKIKEEMRPYEEEIQMLEGEIEELGSEIERLEKHFF